MTKIVDALGESVGNKVEYGHDANGNVTSVTSTEYNQFASSAEVMVTSYEWDVRNRNTLITEDDGGLNIETQRGWDSMGNEVVTTDAESHATRRTFDGLQNLLSTTFDDGGLSITIGQTWDLNSRLLTQVDGNSNTTTYQYNARDLVSEIDYADSTTKAFTYCGCCGRLKTITDQNGSVVTNTYNDAGVLTQRDISRGTGVVGTTREIFTVDGAYRRTRAENKDGSTTISVCEYHYNTLDMVDEEVQTVGSTTARTLTGTYDGAGNLLTCAYPGGRTITRTYDDDDRVSEVKQGSNVLAAYNWAGRRVARRTYLNGIKKEVTFDSARRVTQIRHVNGSSQEKAKLQYAYTLTGNRKYEHRVHDSKADVYRYDGIYQVTGVKFGVPSADVSSTNEWDDYDTWDVKHEWEFDAVGNRETMDRDGTTEEYNYVSGSYCPDPMNEYYKVGGVTQTHDDNGNLTDDGTNAYKYDYANRLMKVTRDSDSAVLGEYKYAADSRRIERVVGSDTQRYYWWGWQLAETRDGSANVIETHVWGVWIDELLTSDLGTSATRYYFLENAIGSVCQATDTSGLVVEEYKYTDIYGKVDVYSCSDSGSSRTLTSVSGTQIGNRTLFQGREWDGEGGGWQFRYRTEDPRLGRFGCRDPKGFDLFLNPYSFVINRPVEFRDPLGEDIDFNPKYYSQVKKQWIDSADKTFRDLYGKQGGGGKLDDLIEGSPTFKKIYDWLLKCPCIKWHIFTDDDLLFDEATHGTTARVTDNSSNSGNSGGTGTGSSTAGKPQTVINTHIRANQTSRELAETLAHEMIHAALRAKELHCCPPPPGIPPAADGTGDPLGDTISDDVTWIWSQCHGGRDFNDPGTDLLAKEMSEYDHYLEEKAKKKK